MEAPITKIKGSRDPKSDVVENGILVARICKSCKQVRDASEFVKMRATGESWGRRCRSCRSDACMALYHTDARYRLRVLFQQRKKYSKINGWPFTIDFDFVWKKIEAGYCEATGLPFDLTCDYRSPFFPSMDQIEPQAGYTPENTRVVVAVFNFAKGVWSDADVLHMARALVAKHDQ